MKSCVICFRDIPYYQQLCKECYPLYKGYMHEPWFMDLVTMQKKQDDITSHEFTFLPFGESTNQAGKHTPRTVSEPKNKGRPPIKYLVANKVLELYDLHEGNISLRRLSREVKTLLGETMNKDTINALLKKHRKSLPTTP